MLQDTTRHYGTRSWETAECYRTLQDTTGLGVRRLQNVTRHCKTLQDQELGDYRILQDTAKHYMTLQAQESEQSLTLCQAEAFSQHEKQKIHTRRHTCSRSDRFQESCPFLHGQVPVWKSIKQVTSKNMRRDQSPKQSTIIFRNCLLPFN